MSFCMVLNCGSVYLRDVGVHFYRIPAETNNKGKRQELNVRRRQMWIAALRRSDITELKLKYGRICSKHFILGKPAHIKDDTNPDWVPSLNMGYQNEQPPQLRNAQKVTQKNILKVRFPTNEEKCREWLSGLDWNSRPDFIESILIDMTNRPGPSRVEDEDTESTLSNIESLPIDEVAEDTVRMSMLRSETLETPVESIESSSSSTLTAPSAEEALMEILNRNPKSIAEDSIGPLSKYRGSLKLVQQTQKRKRSMKRKYIGNLSSDDFESPQKRKNNLNIVKKTNKRQQNKIRVKESNSCNLKALKATPNSVV